MLIGFRSLGLALEPFCCCGAMLGGLSDLNKLDFKAFEEKTSEVFDAYTVILNHFEPC